MKDLVLCRILLHQLESCYKVHLKTIELGERLGRSQILKRLIKVWKLRKESRKDQLLISYLLVPNLQLKLVKRLFLEVQCIERVFHRRNRFQIQTQKVELISDILK